MRLVYVFFIARRLNFAFIHMCIRLMVMYLYASVAYLLKMGKCCC